MGAAVLPWRPSELVCNNVWMHWVPLYKAMPIESNDFPSTQNMYNIASMANFYCLSFASLAMIRTFTVLQINVCMALFHALHYLLYWLWMTVLSDGDSELLCCFQSWHALKVARYPEFSRSTNLDFQADKILSLQTFSKKSDLGVLNRSLSGIFPISCRHCHLIISFKLKVS